jgi:Tn7-like transposition protein D
LRHLLFLQFLGIEVNDLFSNDRTVGKRMSSNKHTPLFSIEQRRKEWLKLIQDNPGATRSQLKEMGKGLHTWIYVHDREWYEKVTPKAKTRKKRRETIDWERRDEECLKLAKEAVYKI